MALGTSTMLGHHSVCFQNVCILHSLSRNSVPLTVTYNTCSNSDWNPLLTSLSSISLFPQWLVTSMHHVIPPFLVPTVVSGTLHSPVYPPFPYSHSGCYSLLYYLSLWYHRNIVVTDIWVIVCTSRSQFQTLILEKLIKTDKLIVKLEKGGLLNVITFAGVSKRSNDLLQSIFGSPEVRLKFKLEAMNVHTWGFLVKEWFCPLLVP